VIFVLTVKHAQNELSGTQPVLISGTRDMCEICALPTCVILSGMAHVSFIVAR